MNRSILGTILALALAACSGETSHNAPGLYDPRTLPAGPVGESIARGHDLIAQTHHLMKAYVRADLSCADCHIAAGTQPRGGSFVGVYGRFPQWNKRAHRVIALQDRIAECFLYSMNGRAPAYSSEAMIAIVAYIAWLSRGTPIGAVQPPSDRYIEPLPRLRRASRAAPHFIEIRAWLATGPMGKAFRKSIRRSGVRARSTTAPAWRTSTA